MPALYTTLSEQVDQALEHLSRRPPQDHPDRQLRDRLWRAGRILQNVLRGLQEDYLAGEDEDDDADNQLLSTDFTTSAL
jgi:hypothetical protein